MADLVADVLNHMGVAPEKAASPISDNRQRIRKLEDAIADVQWLQALFPVDSDTDVHVRLNTAAMALSAALDVAKERV